MIDLYHFHNKPCCSGCAGSSTPCQGAHSHPNQETTMSSLYLFQIPPQHFQNVWAGLGELPAKVSFATMEFLKEQVVAQEKAEKERQDAIVAKGAAETRAAAEAQAAVQGVLANPAGAPA